MTLDEKIREIYALRWVINARWFTITIFLIYFEVVLRLIGFSTRIPLLVLIVVPIFFYTGAFLMLWLIRDEMRTSDFVVSLVKYTIIPLDIAVFTFLLWISGGLGSYVVTFYFFSLIASVAIYSPSGILLTTAFSCFLITAEYFLELRGILPTYQLRLTTGERPPGFFLQDIKEGMANLALVVTSLFMGAIMGSFISYGFRKSTKELWGERDKISSILSVLPDGIIITDPLGKIAFLNKTITNITGIEKMKIINRRVDKSMADTDRRLETLYNILKINVPPGNKVEMKIDYPYEQIFQIASIPLRVGRKPLGMIRVLHNITRERTIGRMKSEFISIAAHQLRTPLSAIKWTFRMMADGDIGKITEEQKEFLERGFQTNERMIKLVSDLLNVSRIEEGRFGYEFIKFSIEKVIEDVIGDASSRIKQKKLDFQIKKPASPLPELTMDPQRIRLAVQNLIDNAIHYNLPGGRIIVKLSREKDFIKVSISDTGVGIPKYQIQRLFTKFFRGENVMRMQTEGSGLGLYIVRNVIKRHGGDIFVESEEGKGSTFTFTLPLSEEKIPQKEEVFESGI